MYKKKINAIKRNVLDFRKIFWNRRNKNFVCLPEISFLLSVQFFSRIQAVKREEKFCYSFFSFFLQARKSFKPDGLLANIRNAIPTASISTPKIRNASIKLVTIDFYFSPT